MHLTGDLDKWDERFIRIAHEVASWSKDPGTTVGAVLVQDKRILATGYNGFPSGIDDNLSRYVDREVKLAYTVHAEVNALLNAAKNGARTEGSFLYTTFHPCVNCAASVIQGGIKRVICPAVEAAPVRWHKSFAQARDLLGEAGVEVLNYGVTDDGGRVPGTDLPEMRRKVPWWEVVLGDGKAR
jgi:dCMP deaminase